MHLLPFGSETEWFMSLCHSTTYRACILLYTAADGVLLAPLPVMLARAFVSFCETPQFRRTVLPTL